MSCLLEIRKISVETPDFFLLVLPIGKTVKAHKSHMAVSLPFLRLLINQIEASAPPPSWEANSALNPPGFAR